jgi:hypothetical protein
MINGPEAGRTSLLEDRGEIIVDFKTDADLFDFGLSPTHASSSICQ